MSRIIEINNLEDLIIIASLLTIATTHKTPTVKAQPQNPKQPNSKTSAKGFKASSPMLRKQTLSKQENLPSSISPEQKLSDTFYEDNEEATLLGKIVFNLELDEQEEQGNESGFDTKPNKYQILQ